MANAFKGLETSQLLLAGENPSHYPNQYSESLVVETDDIYYGMALMEGTAGTQVKKFASASGVWMGCAARATCGTLTDSDDNLVGYEDENVIKVMKTGVMVVPTYEAVTPASTVRVAHAVGGAIVADDIGKFGDSASAGETVVLTGARYLSSGDADDLVEVFIPDTVTISADV